MDYFKMTAPCGLDCFNCHFYLAKTNRESFAVLKKIAEENDLPIDVMFCDGCRAENGLIPLQLHMFGQEHRCAAYECSQKKSMDFCGDCTEFPCENLHPYADKAQILPHNIKVFNLCLIKKLGVEKWAETKAADVRQTYFNKPWTLA